MELLPEIKDGKIRLHDETDDERLQSVVGMVKENHPSAYTKFCKLRHNEGKSVRRALEMVGISICER